MIKIANAQFWVHDQDEALEFYGRTLGWEVRSDVTMEVGLRLVVGSRTGRRRPSDAVLGP
jgi:catechol 2,3-dioxygenase-like lactoylglutathione lyase family enzyme